MGGPAGQSAYLGVDLGTSGLKLTMLGDTGAVLAESEASYQVDVPRPGHAETDPAEWASALVRAASQLDGRLGSRGETPHLAAVGVAGQMHGIVLSDDHGRPVRPAVLWPDQRASETLKEWLELPVSVRARLGNPLVPGMAGPILGWLRHHEPASMRVAAAICSPKDWLRGLLTGDRVTERSDASATLLWDVVSDDWSAEALELAGVARHALARMDRSETVVGTTGWPLVPGSRERSGAGNVPVVAGGADTACALVALEATQRADQWMGSLAVTIGTGIQLLRPNEQARACVDPSTHRYAGADGGWYEMLAIHNGGLALRWVGETLGSSWADLVSTAEQARPGAGGATFLPFLTGERGAVAPRGSTAGWLHLTPSTGRAELARAAFEALAFSVRRGLELMGRHDGQLVLSGEVPVTHGFASWLPMPSGGPCGTCSYESASEVGAAVLAARGVGVALPVPAAVADVQPHPSAALETAYARWVGCIEQDPG